MAEPHSWVRKTVGRQTRGGGETQGDQGPLTTGTRSTGQGAGEPWRGAEGREGGPGSEGSGAVGAADQAPRPSLWPLWWTTADLTPCGRQFFRHREPFILRLFNSSASELSPELRKASRQPSVEEWMRRGSEREGGGGRNWHVMCSLQASAGAYPGCMWNSFCAGPQWG